VGMYFFENMDLMKCFFIKRFKIILMKKTDYNSFLQKVSRRIKRGIDKNIYFFCSDYLLFDTTNLILLLFVRHN
jgi:hypothetical protein